MKISISKIFVAILAIGLSTFGESLPMLNAQTLHPTGLKALHENIPGIPQVETSYSALAALPTSVDLSAQFPAIGDQQYMGSCVAFATAYSLKTYQEGLERGWALNTYDHIFSPAFIYSLGHYDNRPDGGGMYFSTAFNIFVNSGCTTWSDMPYNGNYYAWQTQPTATQMANAASYKAASWGQLPSGSPDQIKAQLAAGNAVVIGIPIYPDFDYLNVNNPVYDSAAGALRGYHALCIVGYDDSMNAFKFMNSWGTGWGLSGYGWIGYDFVRYMNIEAYTMTDTHSENNPTANKDFSTLSKVAGVKVLNGDFNGDGKTDIALVGGAGWNCIPVAFSNGDGSCAVTNKITADFAVYATQGCQMVTGDFNGDGKTDIALVGGPGWNTVPVAFSNGDGSFHVTNLASDFFATCARQGDPKILTGDFNDDGKTDIALVGGSPWNTIPVAFSNGDGTFYVTNGYVGHFAESWAILPGAQVMTGDFNGDGTTDFALVGGPAWNTIPVAFSNGDGNFTVTNCYVGDFTASWATLPGVKILTGDYNGDGITDIALVGGPAWNTIPIAFSNGDGNFNITNSYVGDFTASWATLPGVKVVAGDFNGDGLTDIALAGGPAWNTIPVAFSNGDGNFGITNNYVGDFGAWANLDCQIFGGDLNGDGRKDIFLIGGPNWNTVPMAFGDGSGGFGITNAVVATP